MKPVMMIHEVDEWMFDLPLDQYILTFDDGLYTQYIYLDEIKKIDTEKIFFISTGIVAPEGAEQSDEFIQCHEAHKKLFECNDLSHYMKWSQIHEINEDDRCEIGAHSHMHIIHEGFNSVNDTRIMNRHFDEQGLRPTSFCFPYNADNPIYKAILKQHGYINFYGSGRRCIYDM